MMTPCASHVVAGVLVGLLDKDSASWAGLAAPPGGLPAEAQGGGLTGSCICTFSQGVFNDTFLARHTRMVWASAIGTEDMVACGARRALATGGHNVREEKSTTMWTGLHPWIYPQRHLQVEVVVLWGQQAQSQQRLDRTSAAWLDATRQATSANLDRSITRSTRVTHVVHTTTQRFHVGRTEITKTDRTATL